MRTTKAVLFDMDGTLIDSSLDFDCIRAELGLPKVPLLEAIATMPDQRRRHAEAVLQQHEDRAARQGTLFQHARETLDLLASRGLPVALLTRNSRRSVDLVLARHALAFDAIRTRDDGVNKPSPEPVRALCRSLGVDPAQTVLVGDYLFDIEAAQSAGSLAVLIVHQDQLPDFAHRADQVIRSLRELPPLLEPKG